MIMLMTQQPWHCQRRLPGTWYTTRPFPLACLLDRQVHPYFIENANRTHYTKYARINSKISNSNNRATEITTAEAAAEHMTERRTVGNWELTTDN